MAKKNTDILTPPEAKTPKAAPATVAADQGIPPQSEWTVNGQPFSELHPMQQAIITWNMTDQAIAEREAKPGPRAVVQFLSDESDKRLQRYEDVDDDVHPLSEIKDRFSQPGMHYRFLSPEHRAGKRDYDLVTDEKGEVVKYRGMMLGTIPQEKAQAKERRVARRAEAQLKNTVESMRVDQERAIRDDRRGGMSLLRDGDVLTDHDSPNRGASIGVSLTRGTGADAA